ncbi:MAG: hypothetical protein SGI77_06945 [Pirellulaceae bacterium]|nr:hypothetical protein [Pirellulaceae bacterium]
MDWQTIVALICVSFAGVALLPRVLALLRSDGSTGCGSCGGCSTDRTKVVQKPMVDLNDIADRRQSSKSS